MLMWIVKAFDYTSLAWVVVGQFDNFDSAELHQDSMWLNDASVLTEVEYRGF